jgi:catechol 2,3-dioxygenase-like lactoylglutathione lyase family enzyme
MVLNQITIPSTDVPRSVQFYRTLGLELIVDAQPRYVRLLCEGGTTFSVHQVESVSAGEGVTVYFEHERLDERVKELQDRGIDFDEPPADRSWGWREARLRDPDGNRLILYRAGEMRVNPPWRIYTSRGHLK